MEILNDIDGMRLALEWAARGLYTTSPNPRIGCVIVKDGQVIGAGVTHTFSVTISYVFNANTPPTVCAVTPTPGSGLYNAVSSTNAVLRDLAAAGAAEGTVVITDADIPPVV